MHHKSKVASFLNSVCSFMHSKRRESLCAMVESCLNGESASVTALGRGIKRQSLEKHRIKQADRLLSNKNLHAELEEIYRQLADTVLSNIKRPVLLVDWSNLDSNERHFLLRASVALSGRGITIYEEVHTKKTKEKRRTHKEFLRKLSTILPANTRPILVADAGFRATWFKAVADQGWDWVGRIRGRMKVKLSADSTWTEGRRLEPGTLDVPQDYASAEIAQGNRLSCRVVLFKATPKGRTLLGKLGRPSAAQRAKRAKNANRDPLLLATSLSDLSALEIVNIYSSRMQIEEGFRDMKCFNYGMGLEISRTYKTKRMSVLVIISSLAHAFSWILGQAAEVEHIDKHFQANTEKKYKPLSYVFLGRRVFQQNRFKISWDTFQKAWSNFHSYAQAYNFT
jgi:hypothetical protein